MSTERVEGVDAGLDLLAERRGGQSAPSIRSLGQRLAAITGKVVPIDATGMNRFKGSAMSVEDVADALRPLFAEEGVVTLWTCLGYETSPDKEAAWLLKFHVTVMNAEDIEDFIEADWFDVGSSPTAAASFAEKSFYRRLFHLASADDETKKAGKPKNVQQAVAQIADAYGDPAPELVAVPAGLADLNDNLPKPWADNYFKQELGRLTEAVVRRRLIAEHALQCKSAACSHVAQLAGLK